MSAQAPATCGDDIEVPLLGPEVSGPGGIAALMPTPGAHQSVVAPELVKPATLSASSVALIESTLDRHAG